MEEYKHSPFDEEIFDAMEAYNTNNPESEKFTLVDSRIISLVHSYNYSGGTFFASNQYLASKCFTTPSTVQKSINKLLAHSLINKKVSCVNGRKQRVLTYNEKGAREFKKWAAPQAP